MICLSELIGYIILPATNGLEFVQNDTSCQFVIHPEYKTIMLPSPVACRFHSVIPWIIKPIHLILYTSKSGTSNGKLAAFESTRGDYNSVDV